MSTSLDIDVRAALDQRRGDWQLVARGSGVSYSWISKFMNGHIPNPGFTTLKELHAYLVAAELPLPRIAEPAVKAA
jgi:transcriptional regulator with XRE-family HTH domain